MDLNFAVKQGSRDDEVGERDWSQVNGKINAVIPLQDEAGPFASRLRLFSWVNLKKEYSEPGTLWPAWPGQCSKAGASAWWLAFPLFENVWSDALGFANVKLLACKKWDLTCGVENHCKAFFPSSWVDMKPCINALISNNFYEEILII